MAIGASAGEGGGITTPSYMRKPASGAMNTTALMSALSGPTQTQAPRKLPGQMSAAEASAAAAGTPSQAPAGGGGAPGSGGGGNTLVNNAAADPNLSQFQSDVRNRFAQQMGREGQGDPLLNEQVGNLRNRMSADPRQRAQDFAAQDIGARQRAAQSGLTESMARRGIDASSGAAMELRSKISQDAQKEAARSAAGIAIGRERDLDALTLGGQGIMAAPGQYGLQREGLTNQALGMSGDAAGQLAQQGLGDRSLGLQQFLGQSNQEIARADLAQRQKESTLNQLSQILALQRMAM